MAGFATGIAVVAAEIDERIVGLTVSSLTSVSLTPPMVSISFAHTSSTWPALRRVDRWGVSILGEQLAEVVPALRRPSVDRFSGIDLSVADDGSAHLNGSLAALTVERLAVLDAGDHVLTLLRVVALQRNVWQRPLIHFGGDTHRIAALKTFEAGHPEGLENHPPTPRVSPLMKETT